MRKIKPGTPRPKPSNSFSLIELLIVMTIIAILAALILGAAGGVYKKGMRSRASTEIQAMGTAAEGYKTDNGVYPQSDGILLTNNYANSDGSTAGDEYQLNSQILFESLSSQFFLGGPVTNTAPCTGKVYMSFKANQLGSPAAANSYVTDPWKQSYGYSTGTTSLTQTSYPYNGNGFFDLWTTAGTKVGNTNQNIWISNWSQ